MARLHAQAFDEPWREGALRELLGSPGVFGLLAPEAGFALARVAADEAELLTLAVTPPYRRRGLGSALLEGVVTAVAATEAAALHLEVAVDNIAALRLYEQAGFREAGRRRGYYARPDGRTDASVLTLALNSRRG